MQEEWRPVKGYERRYEVSSLGRVKSLVRIVACGSGFRRVPELIMLLEVHYKGYRRVMLGREHCFVHRIVADAFLDEAHTTDVVNHKNGDKTDNRVENLEWATFKENTQHYHQVLKRPTIPVDYVFDPDDLPF